MQVHAQDEILVLIREHDNYPERKLTQSQGRGFIHVSLFRPASPLHCPPTLKKMPAVSRPAAPAAPSAAQKPLQRWGCAAISTWLLHLPLRATRTKPASPLASAAMGRRCRSKATVTACEVQPAPAPPVAGAGGRRHGQLRAAVFSFYPSHQKTMAVGNRLRIRGEVKGFWGRQMLHRRSGWRGRITRSPHARLPHHAGLPQPACGAPWSAPWGGWIYRHPAAGGGASWRHLFESKWPPALVGIARGAPFCITPRRMWPCPPGRPQPPRLAAPEAEELLAQQLLQHQSAVNATGCAPPAAPQPAQDGAPLHEQLHGRAAVRPHRRAAPRGRRNRRDLAAACPCTAVAAG